MNDVCAWCRHFDADGARCADPVRAVHFEDFNPDCPGYEDIPLRPCPFCGGKGEIVAYDDEGYQCEPCIHGDWSSGYAVRCEGCGAASGVVWDCNPFPAREAMEAWNRREGSE